MQVKSIDHIHIYSADPASSQAFWERHFGAAKVFETRNAHDQAVHILNLGGQNLALSEFPIMTTKDQSYDYIIIGSGAAGAVIACRLAQRPELT